MPRLILFIAFISIQFCWSQDLTVSEEILEELETVVVKSDGQEYTFRVAYPKNYNPEQEYSCFIGLAGGGQSLEIVNYCYAAWFRSGYFDDYFTVLPVMTNDSLNLKNFDLDQIDGMLTAINENFLVKPNWIIGGTSNGGVAAFNFVAAFPNRFEGVIVAPGTLSESIIPNTEWSHLTVILAYGDEDADSWIKAVKSSAKKLKKSVKSLSIVPLKGQGHILPIHFNADKMYDPYFLDSK